jgi:Nucleotidyltransferase of unknown function (DUF6036)
MIQQTIANPLFILPSIASVVRDGLLFDPKNWTMLMATPDINQILETIDRLFKTLNDRQVSYVLVGGVAMLSYIQGRNTQDIDLIMARSDGVNIGLLISTENKDFAQASYEGVRVDLLLNQNKLFKKIQKDYSQVMEWGDHSVVTATPEGLVILKLYALPSLYRQGEFDRAAIYETDILQLVLNYQLKLEGLLKLVKPHVIESDLEELGSIVQDILGRLRRMERNRPSS